MTAERQALGQSVGETDGRSRILRSTVFLHAMSWWTVALIGLGLLGLALWYLGFSTQLPLAAGIGLAARWSGRTWGRWAALPAGIISAMFAESAAMTMTAALGGPLTSRTALFAQAVPLLLFAAMDHAGDGRIAPQGEDTATRPSRWSIALSAAAVSLGPLLFVGAVIVSRARSAVGPVMWAMGGDAWNDVDYMRHAMTTGGITPALMAGYQIIPNGLAAVAATNPARNGIWAGTLLRHDTQAMAWGWGTAIVLTGLVAGLITSWFAQSLGRPARLAATAIGSLTSISGVVLGISLWYGFLTATWGLLLLMCVIMLTLALWKDSPGALAALSAVAALIATSTWTLLAGMALVMAGLAALRSLMTRRRSGAQLAVAALGIAATVALLIYFAAANYGAAGFASMPGPIRPPDLRLELVVAGFAWLAAVLIRKERSTAIWALVGMFGGGILGLSWLFVSGAKLGDYYPEKFLWLLTCGILPIAVSGLFIIAAHAFNALPGAMLRRGALRHSLVAGGVIATSVLAMVGCGMLTAFFPSPVISGWAAVGGLPLGTLSVPDAETYLGRSQIAILFASRPGGERMIFSRGPKQFGDAYATLWVGDLVNDQVVAIVSRTNLQSPDAVCAFVRRNPAYRVVTTTYALKAFQACGAPIAAVIDPRLTPQ